MQGRRRQWELTTVDSSVLVLRTTLDSDELHGGWSALDEAVAFLTRTRGPAPTRDGAAPPSSPTPDLHLSADSTASPSANLPDPRRAQDPSLEDLAAPTAPDPVPAPTSGAH